MLSIVIVIKHSVPTDLGQIFRRNPSLLRKSQFTLPETATLLFSNLKISVPAPPLGHLLMDFLDQVGNS